VTDLGSLAPLVSTGSLLVVAVIMFFLGYDAGRWTIKRAMERRDDASEKRTPWEGD
jgi:hypothetical protein